MLQSDKPAPASTPPSPAPNPARIFETLNAYQRSAALRGAIELELFSAVVEGKQTVEQLARHCRADLRAMRILCDYLVADEFLTKNAGRYNLTPTAALFLDKNSPQYMGSMAKFLNSDHLIDAFRDVAELVRRGRTLLEDQGTTQVEYEGWVEFARSMAPAMIAPAEFIGSLAAVRLPGSIRLLDIAAGHGLFGISVAKHNPHASVVALDWENVLKVARENAMRAAVHDRYELLAGNALTIDYGSGFDLVLVTNFFHHFNPETCRKVMRKIASCLNENGTVITLEFIPNEDRVSPPVPATFAFVMLGTTPEGDAYTFAQYKEMWDAVGLHAHELLDVPNSAQRVIISNRS